MIDSLFLVGTCKQNRLRLYGVRKAEVPAVLAEEVCNLVSRRWWIVGLKRTSTLPTGRVLRSCQLNNAYDALCAIRTKSTSVKNNGTLPWYCKFLVLLLPCISNSLLYFGTMPVHYYICSMGCIMHSGGLVLIIGLISSHEAWCLKLLLIRLHIMGEFSILFSVLFIR